MYVNDTVASPNLSESNVEFADQPAEAVAAPAAVSEPGAAVLYVHLPENAQLYVNGEPTHATGTLRQYISRGLEEGAAYAYTLRAELPGRDGGDVEEQVVVTSAGASTDVRFGFATQKNNSDRMAGFASEQAR